jgi:hypothetical protein
MLNKGTRPPSGVYESCIEFTAPLKVTVEIVPKSADELMPKRASLPSIAAWLLGTGELIDSECSYTGIAQLLVGDGHVGKRDEEDEHRSSITTKKMVHGASDADVMSARTIQCVTVWRAMTAIMKNASTTMSWPHNGLLVGGKEKYCGRSERRVKKCPGRMGRERDSGVEARGARFRVGAQGARFRLVARAVRARERHRWRGGSQVGR